MSNVSGARRDQIPSRVLSAVAEHPTHPGPKPPASTARQGFGVMLEDVSGRLGSLSEKGSSGVIRDYPESSVLSGRKPSNSGVLSRKNSSSSLGNQK